MEYRREIDGLRAVAVMPVLFFHAGSSLFSGGYVGVDIFFVISGYLITSILLFDIQAGKYSIKKFYIRRIRRILPALFFVLALTSVAATMILPPTQLYEFGRSLVSVIFFSSNILFWQESDYFAQASEEKPLLHTWSLSVEEQYYIFFPIVLALLWRFKREYLLHGLVAMTVASLVLSEWAVRNHPVANFYLAPTRAWELLFGSICAYVLFTRDLKASNAVSMVGLILILFGIFAYDAKTPFPSLYALAPVFGTSLIILYGQAGTWAAQILSNRVFVGIGLLSYSIYLIHQPLLALARVRSLEPLSSGVMLAIVMLSIPLSYISWRFIEQPFRGKATNVFSDNKVLVASTAFVSAIFTAIGIYIVAIDGLTPGSHRLIPKIMAQVAIKHHCGDTGPATKAAGGRVKRCLLGDATKAPTIALIGDSHAWHLQTTFSDALKARGLSAVRFEGPLCVPLLNFTEVSGTQISRCTPGMAEAFDEILNNPDIHSVVLAAQWPNYTSGFRGHMTDRWVFQFQDNPAPDAGSNVANFDAALRFTLNALATKNKRIGIVKTVPEFNHHIPNWVLKQLKWGVDPDQLKAADAPLAHYETRNQDVEKAFTTLRQELPTLTFFAPRDALCKADQCEILSADGTLTYRDESHLTFYSAAKVTDPIAAWAAGK